MTQTSPGARCIDLASFATVAAVDFMSQAKGRWRWAACFSPRLRSLIPEVTGAQRTLVHWPLCRSTGHPGEGDLWSELSPVRHLKGLSSLSTFLGGHAHPNHPAPAQVAAGSC